MILALFQLCFQSRLPSSNAGIPGKAVTVEEHLRVKVILDADPAFVEVVEVSTQTFHLPLFSASFFNIPSFLIDLSIPPSRVRTQVSDGPPHPPR